jgi:hypothetical protein
MRFKSLTVAVLVLVTLPAQVYGAGVDLIANGGFETGNFSGWTATSNGIAELTPWTVGPAGGGWFGNTAPLAGQFDAYNGFDGDAGLVYELFQNVAIPANHTAVLNTNHRIQYDSLGIISTFDRIFEISIRDLSNSVLTTLHSQSITMNGAPLTDLGWDAKSFDVSSFAGSTVRVHFREFIPENFTGPANIEFDQISLIATPVPEPASIALLLCGGLVLAARRNR